MENLSKKPPYRNNAHYGSTKSVYDDVFGGPPRFGAPTLSPRPEDYAEIFGGFRGGSRAAATSIPVLDLPPADGAGLPVPFMGRHFDYSEVFGGSDGLDYLVSFEELMEGSKSGAVYDSSDEAWTPAQSETMSNESEPFPCLDRYESMPNAEFHNSNDNMKQFKVSYNKVFLTREDDVANGVAHVAQLNDIPGYSFLVNDIAPIQKMVVTNNLKHEDLSGGLREGKQLRKSHSCEIKPFVTISDISLKTQPSHLPPPARPPPIIGPKNKESDTQNSKFKTSRSFAFGETTSDDDSSLYHDVQVDASSAAAISAAAMKDVMEKAEAKLKSAKNKKERSNKQTKICGETSERDLNGVDKRFSDNARNHGKGYRLLQESSSKNEGFVEWKQDDEFFEVVETDDSRNSENYEHRREKRGSRTISQKEEVNRKLKGDSEIHEKIIVEAVDGEDFENMTKVCRKETEYQQRCEGDLSLKENAIKLRENVERERYEKSLKEVTEREKLENEREVWEREEKEKIEKETHERELEEKRIREAIEKEENEKRIRLALEEREKKQREALEREEKEKREKEAREKEFEEKRLREAIEREETEKRLRSALDEKERKQREAREREEKEREKEARERKELEKREKEAREQEAEEKRRKKVLEEREKKQREAFEKEEKEKRENEAREREVEEKRIEQEEKEKRLKIALEKEENEKKKNLALKRDEMEKKLKDEQNIEEEPNDTPRMGKNKEKVKEKCELEEDTPRVKEIHERENIENSSREDFDQEEIDKMWEEDYKLNGNVSFCGAADKIDKNIKEAKKTKESFSLEDPIIIEVKVRDLNSSDVAQDDLQHNKSEIKTDEVKESLHTHDTVFEFGNKPLKKTANLEKPVLVNHEKKDEKIASSQEVKTKVQSQNEERKSKNLEEREERMSKERELENERLRKIEEEQEREREREREREVKAKVLRKNLEKEREERMNRERGLENERLRKMEEEKEREREREKDRMAVDMASLERVAVEAKLRRERAAVERATAEARERAFQKAKTDKATVEARERIERMRQSSSRSDLCQGVGSSNGSLKASSSVSGGVEVESAQRCKARLERHQRTAQRAAKALEEKNMRDLIAQRELAERNRLAESLDAEVKRWSSGKEGNLRALLSTLQYILGPNSGWQPIHLTGVITSEAVKKAYRKATLCVHPDKLQQRGASIHQKYVCEKVFDLLKAAWNKFNSEER